MVARSAITAYELAATAAFFTEHFACAFER